MCRVTIFKSGKGCENCVHNGKQSKRGTACTGCFRENPYGHFKGARNWHKETCNEKDLQQNQSEEDLYSCYAYE